MDKLVNLRTKLEKSTQTFCTTNEHNNAQMQFGPNSHYSLIMSDLINTLLLCGFCLSVKAWREALGHFLFFSFFLFFSYFSFLLSFQLFPILFFLPFSSLRLLQQEHAVPQILKTHSNENCIFNMFL